MRALQEVQYQLYEILLAVYSANARARVPPPVLQGWLRRCGAAGRLTGIDPTILAAIASRESAAGYQLNSRGYSYHSATKYGYMQLSTTRYHVVTSGGPSGQPHFHQAAKVLRSAIQYVEDHRPYWQKAIQVKAGIAAYDVGLQNYIIPSTIAIDTQTTDKDYSNDVLARTKYLRRKGIF